MIALLGQIVGGIVGLPLEIEEGAVLTANLFGAFAKTMIGLLMGLLPKMSDAPSFGAPEWLKWANWFFPVGALIDMMATLISLFIAYQAVRIMLKWLRAV